MADLIWVGLCVQSFAKIHRWRNLHKLQTNGESYIGAYPPSIFAGGGIKICKSVIKILHSWNIWTKLFSLHANLHTSARMPTKFGVNPCSDVWGAVLIRLKNHSDLEPVIRDHNSRYTYRTTIISLHANLHIILMKMCQAVRGAAHTRFKGQTDRLLCWFQ